MKFYKIINSVIFITILNVLGGCNKKQDSLSQIYDEIVTHYSTVDPSVEKFHATKFLFDNLKYHTKSEYDSDMKLLSVDFFINHIDDCYNNWKNSPYSNQLSFAQFTEYILPYVVIDGALPILNSKRRRSWITENIMNPDSIKSIEDFINTYNNRMSYVLSDKIDCSIKASHCVLCLRALGIPAVAERNFAYRKLISSHIHCAIYDQFSDTFLRFNAADINSKPDSTGWNYQEMQNIYRIRYSPDYDSPVFLKRTNESIISYFSNPCMTDVSRTGFPLHIKLNSESAHNIKYLAIFNRDTENGMRPVTWGLKNLTDSTFSYRKVMPNTLYFPGISTTEGFKATDTPFYIETTDGKSIQIIYPDFVLKNPKSKQSIVLKRKYPIKESDIENAKGFIGTCIQASNTIDFKNPVKLLEFESPLQMKIQRFSLSDKGEFKYYRYKSDHVKSNAKVSILRWFYNDKEINPINRCEVNDNDMTTSPNDSINITVCFEKPVRLNRLLIAPKNSDNSVTAGHDYILRAYDNNQLKWIFIDRKKAYSDSIQFDNVPEGSLLWLSDLSKGREESPFIYSDNKQLFIYHDIIPE